MTDLSGVKFGGRLQVGAVRGDMNISINIVFCNCFNDAFGAFHVNIIERKVPETGLSYAYVMRLMVCTNLVG